MHINIKTFYFSSLNNSIEELVLGKDLPYEQKRKYGISVNSYLFEECGELAKNTIWFVSKNDPKFRKFFYRDQDVAVFSVNLSSMEVVDDLRQETSLPSVVMLQLNDKEYNVIKNKSKKYIEFPFCQSCTDLASSLNDAIMFANETKQNVLIPFSEGLGEDYNLILKKNLEEEITKQKILAEKQLKEYAEYTETVEKICEMSDSIWQVKNNELIVLKRYGRFNFNLKTGDVSFENNKGNEKRLCIQCAEKGFAFSNTNNLRNVVNLSRIFAVVNDRLPKDVLLQMRV